ncbi:MAG: hypothetical protein RL272_687 [Candidatus Parcubacteria bacterium]|jgi:hypothetical protein
MKRYVIYAAAVAGLLLAGAGCPARQQAATGLAPAGAPADRGVKAETTIDGAVDAILKGSEAEKEAVKERQGDVADVNADDADLNAVSEGSYEIK